MKPSGSIIAAGSIEGSDVEKDLDGGVSMWTPLGSKTSRGSRFLVYDINDWARVIIISLTHSAGKLKPEFSPKSWAIGLIARAPESSEALRKGGVS